MFTIDPPRGHRPADHLYDLERPEQVDFDHAAELVERQVFNPRAVAAGIGRLVHACVVDQDRGLAESAGQRHERAFDRFAAGHVAVDAL